MWPFRRPETLPNASQRHDTVLDLIEQVASLRGQLGALEIEWKDVKDTVKKSYQRIERANTRADRRAEDEDGNTLPDTAATAVGKEPVPLHGFAKKLHEMKGA